MLTTLSDRQHYTSLIKEATAAGARKSLACKTIGLNLRTLQRWQRVGDISADNRPTATRPLPANKLSEMEQQTILDICNQEKFAHLSACQIVPILADDGIYIASDSSFYRVLKANNQLTHRGKSKPKGSLKKPEGFTAQAPCEVWTWDISYCPSTVIGQFFYLYMIMDIFSRKVVGWEIHDCESGEHAANLLERTLWSEKCVKGDVVLHSDNGSPMKSLTMQAKMKDMGVIGSRSRPGVSNDNPYSESLFRTVKYNHRWPGEGFKTLEEARTWVEEFVHWYNTEHRHSRIKFVTPEQRHQGKDHEILAKRAELFANAQKANPCRWSGNVRDWSPLAEVELNPVSKKEAA